MDGKQMAGVAGLPSDSNINGCDTKTAFENPLKGIVNQRRCRTSRKYPATPEQRGLIALCASFGADTPVGRRCSNLGQQLKHFPNATGDARVKLAKAMRESHDDLTRLTGRG